MKNRRMKLILAVIWTVPGVVVGSVAGVIYFYTWRSVWAGFKAMTDKLADYYDGLRRK